MNQALYAHMNNKRKMKKKKKEVSSASGIEGFTRMMEFLGEIKSLEL
jgi:hypothetical protein